MLFKSLSTNHLILSETISCLSLDIQILFLLPADYVIFPPVIESDLQFENLTIENLFLNFKNFFKLLKNKFATEDQKCLHLFTHFISSCTN